MSNGLWVLLKLIAGVTPHQTGYFCLPTLPFHSKGANVNKEVHDAFATVVQTVLYAQAQHHKTLCCYSGLPGLNPPFLYCTKFLSLYILQDAPWLIKASQPGPHLLPLLLQNNTFSNRKTPISCFCF